MAVISDLVDAAREAALAEAEYNKVPAGTACPTRDYALKTAKRVDALIEELSGDNSNYLKARAIYKTLDPQDGAYWPVSQLMDVLSPFHALYQSIRILLESGLTTQGRNLRDTYGFSAQQIRDLVEVVSDLLRDHGAEDLRTSLCEGLGAPYPQPLPIYPGQQGDSYISTPEAEV